MLGGEENIRGIVDPDRVVGRRMHDQQRLVQLSNLRHQALLGDVVEELALDVERPPGKLNLHLALRADVLDAVLEEMGDMRGVGGGRDRDDRLGVRDLSGGGEDRGAAQAVADQDRGRPACLAQMIGGADEIGDIRREGRVGELAFAGTEAGKVEPQHRDAPGSQCNRDAFRRQHILAAGEAMRKQRVGVDRSIRRIQRGGKLMAAFAGKLKAFMRHGFSPRNCQF
jgi:hypothetical protein